MGGRARGERETEGQHLKFSRITDIQNGESAAFSQSFGVGDFWFAGFLSTLAGGVACDECIHSNRNTNRLDVLPAMSGSISGEFIPSKTPPFNRIIGILFKWGFERTYPPLVLHHLLNPLMI
jgi:hypothetical protein